MRVVETSAITSGPLGGILMKCSFPWCLLLNALSRHNIGHCLFLYFAMLTGNVPQKLVLAVVAVPAGGARCADIGLVFNVSPLMVISVADGGESFGAELTNVGFFTSVDSDVDLEITPLVKDLVTENGLACFGVCAHDFCADKVLILLFSILWRLFPYRSEFLFNIGNSFSYLTTLSKINGDLLVNFGQTKI